MTVQTNNNSISYVGNGSTVHFDYDYLILNASHLKVYFGDVLQTSGYVVSGVSSQTGGTVAFAVAPPNGANITLIRDVPFLQLTDYQPYDAFPAESHERALDLLTMMTQQLKDELGRTMQYPVGGDKWDAKGNEIINVGTGSSDTSAPNIGQVKSLITSLAGPDSAAQLRADLADATGADLVATSPQAPGAAARSVRSRLLEQIFLGDFAGVDRTGAVDSSAAVRNAVAYAMNITNTSGTDNAESKSVTINLGRGIIRIDSTVLIPRNIVITSDGAAIVSDSDDFVFESGYVLNGALVSNMGLSDTKAIANRLVGTRLDNLTFYRCSRAIRMRAFNEQCGLRRLRFYQCGTAYAVYQAFYSNYEDIIIRQVKSGLDNLPAVIYGRASNRISTDKLCIVSRNKGIEFGEPGAFGVYGSASCQFSGLSLEVLNEGFKFIGQMRNISIIGTYIEQVSFVFFDTDGDVKHEITIKDSYSYSSAFYVDMSGLRDSFIGGITDAFDPVNKAAVRLREDSFGNTATVEVYGLDDGTTGNNRYRLSMGVLTTGVLIKYTGGPYPVFKSQEFAYNDPESKYAKQVPVCDIGWYGVSQNYVIGTVSGGVSNTQGTEIYALTNFYYSEYTALNYSIKVTPNVGSGGGGTTPSPILLKGVVIGGHATQIVPNGISVSSSVRDNTTGTIRLNFGPFGSSASDPAFAWMRNGLFTSEGIIKLIA